MRGSFARREPAQAVQGTGGGACSSSFATFFLPRRLGTGAAITPLPSHSGQRPCSALKVKWRGSSSLVAKSHFGQALFVDRSCSLPLVSRRSTAPLPHSSARSKLARSSF